MRVLIADDEPLALDLLDSLLTDHPQVDVVGRTSSGEEALAAITALDPDLVILDIAMAGIGGVAAAQALQGRRRPVVVFATAHTEHALEAFDIGVADYLLKPISRQRLSEALRRVRQRLNLNESESRPVEGSIWVATRHGRVRIDMARITHAVAARDYVWLHDDSGRAWLHRTTLTRLAELAASHGLVRAHRSVLIRPEAIRFVQRRGKGYVAVMESGLAAPISQTRHANITPHKHAAKSHGAAPTLAHAPEGPSQPDDCSGSFWYALSDSNRGPSD